MKTTLQIAAGIIIAFLVITGLKVGVTSFQAYQALQELEENHQAKVKKRQQELLAKQREQEAQTLADAEQERQAALQAERNAQRLTAQRAAAKRKQDACDQSGRIYFLLSVLPS